MRVWVALCVALFMSTVAIPTAAYATVPGTNGKTISTTMDSLIPGAVAEGRRSVWSFGRVEVLDTGIDGDADTLWNNELFAVQGIFVP